MPQATIYKSSKWHRVILGVICFLFFQGSCLEQRIDSFPWAPVHYELSLSVSRYEALRTPGGIARIQTVELATSHIGLGGLIIVRSLLEHNAFSAYDLACPVEQKGSIRLEITDTEAICPSCHSHYDLLSGYGHPTQGVAQRPLKRYRAEYLAVRNTLLITNE